jgi:hypothetical protein
MITLAPINNSKIPNARFAQRGETALTQGQISEVNCYAKPRNTQLAYQGYKANIDMFVAATLRNETLSVHSQGADVNFFNTSLPISIGPVIISFKDDITTPTLDAVLSGIKKFSPVSQNSGIAKHKFCFTIQKPTYTMLVKLEPFVKVESPRMLGVCTRVAGIEMAKVLCCVEGYLRTNQYPAFRKEGDAMEMEDVGLGLQKRKVAKWSEESSLMKRLRYTEGVSMTHAIGDQTVKEDGIWIGSISDADVEIPGELNQVVINAKPSKQFNLSNSVFHPRNLPKETGILFPYFDGMNLPDPKFIMSTISNLFFRTLGKDPKASVSLMRRHVGDFATTKSAVALAHLLKGVEISLDSQGQLMVLADKGTYLGFVVIGAGWDIMFGNSWFSPDDADTLQEQIRTVKTHEGSLVEVLGMLREDGIKVDEVECGVDLAVALSKVKFSGEEEEVRERQEAYEEAVNGLDFGTRPVGAAAETILEAVMTIGDVSMSLQKQHVYFPKAAHYHYFTERAAVVWSRFGQAGPSFRIGKTGVGHPITQDMAKDNKEGEIHRKGVKTVMFTKRSFIQAYQDLVAWVGDSFRVYESQDKRAQGYQFGRFSGAQADKFLKGVAGCMQSVKVVMGVKDDGKKKIVAEAEDVDMDVPAPVVTDFTF